MPKKKPEEKPVEKMEDRELAEHVLGKELVEKMHEEFDLRDTSKEDVSGSTPTD